MRSAFALAALSAVIASPRPASACSLAGNGTWIAAEDQTADTTPPSAPTAEVTGVFRSEDDSQGCVGATSSCGSIASIHLAVSATDDTATADQIGYEITLVGGEPPAGFDPSREGRVVPFGDELNFYFDFDAPSFSMDLEIRAVDGNGNLGPPVVLTVEDEIDQSGGCAAGANGNLVGFGMLAFATAFALRRRR